MRAFTRLFEQLDGTTKTTEKLAALVEYFRSVPPADGAWAIYFLTGRRLKRLFATKDLRTLAQEQSGIDPWLFDECYSAVGDLAETIALLLPPPVFESDLPLHLWIENRLLRLLNADRTERFAMVLEAWRTLGEKERLVWNKLITGGFRVGVSGQLASRALAQTAGVPQAAMAHRLMGDWKPTPEFYQRLLSAPSGQEDSTAPFPFFLASPLEQEPDVLGHIGDWLVEWKWDGIRAQCIHRHASVFLWSRGEDNLTERFPEVVSAVAGIPCRCVLDGEVLPFKDGRPQPFSQLQRRITRKRVAQRLLDESPVVFMAYDLIELDGRDLRPMPLLERRALLERLVADLNSTKTLRLSPALQVDSWHHARSMRDSARARGVEGLMLKRRRSSYQTGRVRGDWWKWKIDPMTVDAVLTYAQIGHGKRANLYTDYTFAVWKDDQLVTIAKAYSGLSDSEIREVDRFIRANTVERFGPVRTVRPELVFELAFEGIQRSPRHKSGIAVRFPRIVRRRTDKQAKDADRIERLFALLSESGNPVGEIAAGPGEPA